MTKKKFTILILLCLVTFLLLLVATAYAQGTNPGGGGGTNPIKIELKNPFAVGDNLYDVAKAIVNNVILPIGGVLAVLAFIYSGFKFVMARGKEKEITDAKNALLYSVIGTAVLLGAWVIANVIENTIKQLM
jgi:TRAP-type C4-dicarboxylate transport system permease small subunit